jgi:hypothetical protein
MKTYTLIFILLITTSLVYGQRPLKNIKKQVAETELLKNWKTGKSKTFAGQHIIKLSGAEDGGRTNISYMPPAPGSELQACRAGTCGTIPAAGKIAVFIDRLSEREANTEWFTVTVSDPNTGEELSFTKLDAQAPEYFPSGVWYNYVEVNVAKVLPVFDVQVYDNYTLSTYKYEVILSSDNEENEPADLEMVSSK